MRGHIANTLHDVGEKNKLYNDGRGVLFLQVASKRAVFLQPFLVSFYLVYKMAIGITGTIPHNAAHDVFMTLPPYSICV